MYTIKKTRKLRNKFFSIVSTEENPESKGLEEARNTRTHNALPFLLRRLRAGGMKHPAP